MYPINEQLHFISEEISKWKAIPQDCMVVEMSDNQCNEKVSLSGKEWPVYQIEVCIGYVFLSICPPNNLCWQITREI